ncbi:MAG: ComF family protein [Lachnospiraceae bacterium]|nr:ComF family protein [Lachnospiraceae bacterium]
MKIKRVARGVAQYAIDLLYPRRCMVCHQPAPVGEYICPECEKRLPIIESARCRKCGKPVEAYEAVCRDCAGTRHLYDRGIGIYRYESVMREAVSFLKYKGRREYGEAMGVYAARAARSELATWRPEVIVPIPIHQDRLRERGYNQAEVIARAVSKESGIRLAAGGLVRKGSTSALKALSSRERYESLARVFAVGSGLMGVKSALIVDDIYTTGATVDAGAKILRSAGVGRIYFLSVCIGGGFMVSY